MVESITSALYYIRNVHKYSTVSSFEQLLVWRFENSTQNDSQYIEKIDIIVHF